MDHTQPEYEPESRPGSMLENVSVLKKWLFGIAVVSLLGVLSLLVLNGGEQSNSTGKKTAKDIKERAGYEVKGTVNGYEWVDLGLPSGTKWATYNVGAASPAEFGDYYAWGETETKDEYVDINSVTHRKSFKWLLNNGIINDNGDLTRQHDIASIIWGEPWRMPTDEEYEELIDFCDWKFTDYNGTNGYLVTGPNNETVFFVAAGFKQGSGAEYIGEYGDYWSSSVVPELIGASCSLGYGSTSYGRRRYARFVGRTIRPVTD